MCDARFSPCRPSWLQFRVQLDISGSRFLFCSEPRHRRNCPFDPYQPSLPDAWGDRQWRGTQLWGRHPRRTQLCTFWIKGIYKINYNRTGKVTLTQLALVELAEHSPC